MALLAMRCFNLDSAIAAIASGANRIELCDSTDEGGTTLLVAWLSKIRSIVTVRLEVNVMVRPQGGNFIYTHEECETTKETVASLKTTGMCNCGSPSR